jgi:uncharacterized OB-fold protein
MTPQPRAPTPEGLNLEFYEHAASGMLHLQQCTECGRFRHPPRYYCPYCFSPSYRWTPSAGAGRLFSWTITHFPFDRGWEEGTRVIGAFDGDADADLRVGLDLVATVDIEAYGFPFLRFARP